MENLSIPVKKTTGYAKILSLIFVFVFLTFVNFCNGIVYILNGEIGTLWYWNFILIGFIALFYIIKIHKFYLSDFLTAIAFATVVYFTSGINPIQTPAVMMSWYAGCCIFRKYNFQDKIFASKEKTLNGKIRYNFKLIGFGLLIALVPAFINCIEFYISGGYKLPVFDISKFIPAVFGAVQPAIFEEIPFRFFLYAFVLNAFKGEIPKTKAATFITYFLLIVPHCIMHKESMMLIVQNPLTGLLYLAYMCAVFGVPTVWLIKNRGIQSSMSAHWMYDFARFMFF